MFQLAMLQSIVLAAAVVSPAQVPQIQAANKWYSVGTLRNLSPDAIQSGCEYRLRKDSRVIDDKLEEYFALTLQRQVSKNGSLRRMDLESPVSWEVLTIFNGTEAFYSNEVRDQFVKMSDGHGQLSVEGIQISLNKGHPGASIHVGYSYFAPPSAPSSYTQLNVQGGVLTLKAEAFTLQRRCERDMSSQTSVQQQSSPAKKK